MSFPNYLQHKGIPELKANFQDFLKFKEVESLQDKDAEELAGLYNEFNDITREAIQKALESKASEEAIEKLRSELSQNTAEQLKTLNEVLKQQGIAITKLNKPAAPKEGEPKSFSEALRKSLEENKEKLSAEKNIAKSEAKGFDFEVKVPGTMTGANISGGNVPLEDRLPGFDIVPSRRVRLLDIMAAYSTTSNIVSWVSQANKDGTAGQTGEGLAKNQIDFDIVVNSEEVKKTTSFIKVTTEMLDDISWLQSEIENELIRELLKAVELTAYSGDGLTVNHNGVRTQASAFAAGTFAGAVDEANDVDVLAVAANQIRIAQEMEAEPNFIMMHPSDVTNLKLIKVAATDRRYVDRLAMVGSTLSMDGIPIVETTLVTAGEYLIGDFRHAILVTKEGIRIDIGLDGNDFTLNLRTILAEWRGCTVIRTNRTSAFVAGVFATDKAALETP